MPEIGAGWEVASAPPGGEPGGWAPAVVPAWAPEAEGDLDARDWWFRVRFARPEDPAATELRLEGVASVWEARLNGAVVAAAESMFEPVAVDVAGALRDGENELVVVCRALGPLLEERRRPRARWRTQVAAGNLRFFRTSLFGRAPGFAPGPAPVGPWRPVTLGPPAVDWSVRAQADGRVVVRGPEGARAELGSAAAEIVGGVAVLRSAHAEPWWPWTHGQPALHTVRLLVEGDAVAERRVGFRTITSPGEIEEDGLHLHVNGVPVFARGAVWTPVPEAEVRPTLERAREAGFNLIRVVGTATYESEAFFAACDELGLLVWQDVMLANFDYPPDLFPVIGAEAAREVGRAAAHPSLAVVCGGSEVEQQAAMFGAPREAWRSELVSELLPRVVAEAAPDAIWVPNAPCGGETPFRTDRGVANYFGVGGYRRPLEDARRAGVRFASECLAFANVSDEPDLPPGAGVMRDVGADWDFAAVRAHYERLLYGEDPPPGAAADVSGEVMARVFGEWRRTASPCGGGIVLWLRDLVPGAGWGVLDSRGRPKAAAGHLARALAPVAVWMTDEGQNGVALHVANDGPEPLRARLRVALYRDFALRTDEVAEELSLDPHTTIEQRVEGLLGRFADVSYAFRFGPPAQDLVLAALEDDGGPIAQAMFFPAGRPALQSAEELGLSARADAEGVELFAERLVHGVRLRGAGFEADDDAFALEPGRLRRVTGRGRWAAGTLTAVNLTGALEIPPGG